MDPVLLYLLISYPIVVSFAVYAYLKIANLQKTVTHHLLSRWHLYGFIKTCSVDTDPQRISEEAVLTLSRLLEPNFIRIYHVHRNPLELQIFRQSARTPAQTFSDYTVDLAIPKWVVENKEAVVINDLSVGPYLGLAGLGNEFRSTAAVPGTCKDQVVALFILFAKDRGFFDDTNVMLIQMIASLYAAAISRV